MIFVTPETLVPLEDVFGWSYTPSTLQMNALRITLIVRLLAGAGYLAYVKTRSAAVPMRVALDQYQYHQEEISPSAPAVQAKSLVDPTAAPTPTTASTQETVVRNKLDQEIIARAKAAKLSALQKGMPEQAFGDWVESNFAGKAKITWEINDCGENDGSGHQEELPVCAEADLNFPSGKLISVSVAVASVRVGTGVHTFGPAGLFNAFFTNDNKKFCSPSLDGIAEWAKGNRQESPCTSER